MPMKKKIQILRRPLAVGRRRPSLSNGRQNRAQRQFGGWTKRQQNHSTISENSKWIQMSEVGYIRLKISISATIIHSIIFILKTPQFYTVLSPYVVTPWRVTLNILFLNFARAVPRAPSSVGTTASQHGWVIDDGVLSHTTELVSVFSLQQPSVL